MSGQNPEKLNLSRDSKKLNETGEGQSGAPTGRMGSAGDQHRRQRAMEEHAASLRTGPSDKELYKANMQILQREQAKRQQARLEQQESSSGQQGTDTGRFTSEGVAFPELRKREEAWVRERTIGDLSQITVSSSDLYPSLQESGGQEDTASSKASDPTQSWMALQQEIRRQVASGRVDQASLLRQLRDTTQESSESIRRRFASGDSEP